MSEELEKLVLLKNSPRIPILFPGERQSYVPKHLKPRLVMKRLCNVKRGDIMVGRMDWQTLGAVHRITSVRESTSRPGKLRLDYALENRFGGRGGRVYRWPDFYVICVKQGDV